MRKDKPQQISLQLEKFKETLAKRQKYVKNEYQAYGLELAKELGDIASYPGRNAFYNLR